MKKRILTFLLVLFLGVSSLIIFALSSFGFQSSFDSKCFFPKISPDEKYISHWHRKNKPGTTGIYPRDTFVTLYLYEIENNKEKIILEKDFSTFPIGVCYMEIIDEFYRVSWSPDSRYLAISIDGLNLYIYDINIDKIISCFCFRHDTMSFYVGYFYLNWVDNNSLIAGYISPSGNISCSEDTYAHIKKIGNDFNVYSPSLTLESDYIPDKLFYLDYEKYKKETDSSKKLPIITFNKNEIVDIFIQQMKRDYDTDYDHFFDYNYQSNQKPAIETSKNGKYAIVLDIETLKTQLIKIPEHLRNKIIKNSM